MSRVLMWLESNDKLMMMINRRQREWKKVCFSIKQVWLASKHSHNEYELYYLINITWNHHTLGEQAAECCRFIVTTTYTVGIINNSVLK